MVTRRLWTRDELILALNLYLKLPLGKLDSRTLEVTHLAKILERTPSSIAMRLNNFASVDPFHQQRGIGGLPGGRAQVEPIWKEFINNKEELLFESERILAEKEQTSIDDKFTESLKGTEHLKGEYKIREVKTRVNQMSFAKLLLRIIPDLLLASHIIPWSKNEEERLNPENGICLSPLYDRAYDQGYISINENYEILLSSFLKKKSKEEYHLKYFAPINGMKIILPKKYLPKKSFCNITWWKCLESKWSEAAVHKNCRFVFW